MQHKVPAVFMRGGTSRAICFREDDLAGYDGPTRERIILAALGSPDMHGRQVDGLGGGISSLSKVAIIGKSTRDDTDVTFTFGQVDVHTPTIDWSSTCGNISAAVGPFAIDEGLVPAVEPFTQVRVLATNTGKRYIAQVPVCHGQAEVEGEYTIDGVSAPGACIRLEYLEPGGSLGGVVLPTGTPRQELSLASGRRVTVSVVDAAIPTIFVRAEELAVDARCLAPELDSDQSLQTTLEEIRCRGAVLLGLADSVEDAHTKSPATPKIALVAPPAAYASSGRKQVRAEQIDLLGRAISMGNTHRTFPGTVSMCTAVAAAVEGTVVHQVSRAVSSEQLRIGHPAGVMEVGARVTRCGSEWRAERVITQRTARRIMEGAILVPAQYLENRPWFRAER
jgi:2-methylaconitate cis-trans-isomerase PrpF